MGGIRIDSALQVGFMPRPLLHRYQAMVQEFCLGLHSLTEASLFFAYVLVKQLQIHKIMQYSTGNYAGISTEKIVIRQS
jgi:hypothetical protein